MQIVKKQQKNIEVNLGAVLQLLWKRKWWIILSAAVAMLVFYVYTILFATPMYMASATLYANNSSSSDGSTSITTSDMNASARLVDTYAAIIMSDPVLDQVIAENGLRISASKLSSRIEIDQVYNTEVFKITVSDANPQTAADIANSIAEIAPLKIQEIVDGCSIKIVSLAKVPGGKASPNYQKVLTTGCLVGVVVSVLAICVFAVLDTRVKSEADLDEWEYPVIGVIPSFAEAEKVRTYANGNSYKEISKNELVQ